MSSADFQSARSLERFLLTLVLGAGGVGLGACGWVPGRSHATIHTLPPGTPVPVQANPGYDTCAAYCGGPVRSCRFELAAPSATPGASPVADFKRAPPLRPPASQQPLNRFSPRTASPVTVTST